MCSAQQPSNSERKDKSMTVQLGKNLNTQAAELAAILEDANRITVFTGAGISTESGIADFRSPGGIWTKMKPIQFGDFRGSEAMRLEDWRRRFHFQSVFENAPVNAGHHAVSSIVCSDRGGGLITQNIDGLHQRAGILDEEIVEIHGNGVRATCLDCKSSMALSQAKNIIESTGKAPVCNSCGGLVKSAVISFGQPIPQEKMLQAQLLAMDCDLFLVLGSSLTVQPAASLPVMAVNNGAKLVIVNNQPTPLESVAHLAVQAPLGRLLKKALEKSVFAEDSAKKSILPSGNSAAPC
jgi:NAD-dependent deacetylase